MASVTTESLWYVYGIVPGAMSASSMPAGLDDAQVSLQQQDGVGALVSQLDASVYGPDMLETSSGDVEWLSPRAVAHDLVLTWASDRGAVIPLPMFSLFSSGNAVEKMLHERAPALTATLAHVARGREYALRVYRVDGELLRSVGALSPRLKEMSDAAAAASPGQRYLLERKLDGEGKTEMRSVSAGIVEEIVAALSAASLEFVRSPIPRAAGTDAGGRGTMVLNAAFLVSPGALEGFQRTLATLVEKHASHGFRFDFTGPWPPYHFVGEGGHGA
ncbi:MAG: GvpL/GvpF family gas vesicle protein [Gemmatimonadaceae bacterium]